MGLARRCKKDTKDKAAGAIDKTSIVRCFTFRAECFTFQVPSLAVYIPVISDSIVASTKTAPILFGPDLDYKSTNKGTIFAYGLLVTYPL